MSFVKMKMAIYFFLLALFIAVFLLNAVGLVRPPELMAGAVGYPKVVVRDNDFICTHIAQIVSDDSYIYVLFGQYSVVQVYTKDGIYQYSISVYNHPNGRTKIASCENNLYILDKQHNIYVFHNGTIIEFIDRDASDAIRKKISFGQSDPDYFIRAGSIWITPENGEAYCVVERPAWMAFYQGTTSWLCIFFLAILSWVVLLIPDLSKIKKN